MRNDKVGEAADQGPEEFVNYQGLLVQSSKWFGISSVQFRSLITSLLDTSFSSFKGPPILKCSVSSVQFDDLFSGTTDGAAFGVGTVRGSTKGLCEV